MKIAPREQLVQDLAQLTVLSRQLRVNISVIGEILGKRDRDMLDILQNKMIDVEMLITKFGYSN